MLSPVLTMNGIATCFFGLFLTATLVAGIPQGSPEIVVPDPGKGTAHGSGLFWFPGGSVCGGRKVLFVGHPNSLNRGDRALMNFDLRNFLALGKVKAARLDFLVVMMFGPYDVRQLRLERFCDGRAELVHTDITSPLVESVAFFLIERRATFPKAMAFDVTAAVNAALGNGYSNLIFRLKDEDAEKMGNPNGKPTGSAISVNGIKLTIKR